MFLHVQECLLVTWFCENKGEIWEGSVDCIAVHLILPTKMAWGSNVKHLTNKQARNVGRLFRIVVFSSELLCGKSLQNAEKLDITYLIKV